MKKLLTFFVTVGMIISPFIAEAYFSVPWAATSTSQGWVSPFKVNGVEQAAVATYFHATSTTASVFPYASTTALTVSGIGGLYVNTLTGYLKATSGAVTAQSAPIPVSDGGTGAVTLTGCLTGNGTGAITGSGTCNTSNASVSSVGTNNGLTGGTITTTGTIGLNITGLSNRAVVAWDGSNLVATGTQQLTVGNLLATTTTATSTFSGGFTAGNNSAFTVNQAATANSLNIASNGKIGIANASPRIQLDVTGTSYFNRPTAKADANGGAADFGGEVDFTNTDFAANKNGYIRVTYPDTNTIRFGADFDGSVAGAVYRDIQFGRTGTPYVTFKNDTTGNVGIGTTSPSNLLSVQGNGYISSNLFVGGTITSTTTATSTFGGPLSTTNFANTAMTAGSIPFFGAGGFMNQSNANLYWDAVNNRLGIGNSSPIVALQVGAGTNPGELSKAVIFDTNTTLASDTYNLVMMTTDAQAANLGADIGLGGVYSGSTGSVFGIIGGRKENGTSGNLAGYLQFSTRAAGSGAPAERMRIDSTGNVGIATTTPWNKLDVVGNAMFGSRQVGQNIALQSMGSPQYGSAIYMVNDNGSTQGSTRFISTDNLSGSAGIGSVQYSNFALQYSTNTQGYGSDPSTLTYSTALTVEGKNGNVGIGTTTPANKLNVTTTGTTAAIRLENTSSQGNLGYFGISSQTNALITGDVAGDLDILSNNGKVNFSTNNGTNNSLTITTTGNVGIGTTTPSQKLDVNGNVNIEGTGGGVIVKDTANGLCYIIQVTNGVVTPSAHACQ